MHLTAIPGHHEMQTDEKKEGSKLRQLHFMKLIEVKKRTNSQSKTNSLHSQGHILFTHKKQNNEIYLLFFYEHQETQTV
jgi:hypothetical protein